MTDVDTLLQLRDPVFKGCTRPAMFAGVPLIPFVLVCGAGTMLAMWGLVIDGWLATLSAAVTIALVLVMRQMTSRDDQRLHQWLLRARLRAGNRNRGFWGAVSYAAIRYKRRLGP